MKPLHYTFNGEEHEMSAQERFSIEIMGVIDIPIPGFRERLLDTIEKMRQRPGITEQENAMRNSIGDTVRVWHMVSGCGRWSNGDRVIHQVSFLSTWKIAPDSCCWHCLSRCKMNHKIVDAEADRAAFMRLRARVRRPKSAVLYATKIERLAATR